MSIAVRSEGAASARLAGHPRLAVHRTGRARDTDLQRPAAHPHLRQLHDLNGLGAPQWVGFANYQRAFSGQDAVLLVGLKNTILFTIGYVPFAIAVGLALALLANERLRGIIAFRALFFLPRSRQ